jgi:branched-chain amino acid transport system permease protein
MELGPVIVDGLITGMLFSLLAIALIVLFQATGVLNFAQGELGMVLAFVTYAIIQTGVPVVPAVLLGLLISALGGVALYFCVIRVRADDALALSLRTLALFLLLRAVAEKIWAEGAPYNFPNAFPDGSVVLLGTTVTYVKLGAVGFGLALTLAIVFTLNRSRIGLLVRAVSQDRETASDLGVDVRLVDTVSWALAAVVGAMVAIFFSMIASLSPGLMDPYLLAGLAAAMLGGLKSITGAIAGGLVLGLARSGSAVYLNSPEWSEVLAFAILFAGVLLTRGKLARAVRT